MDKIEGLKSMDELEKFVLLLTIKLYALTVSRSEIQQIIQFISIFIKNAFIPILLKNLDEALYKVVSDEVNKEIHRLLNEFRDQFEKYSSEEKRIRLYSKLGLYVEPEVLPMATLQVNKVKETKLSITDKAYSVVRIPLGTSLKRLLELDGLFDKTKSNMDYLKSESKVLMNFIQGELWKSQLQNFHTKVENIIIFPLICYFDDLELGNALGSHSGINSIGAVYTWIPCLPPWFASKLDSIIFSDIFHTIDRKRFGNRAAFQYFLADLQELYDNGIEIYDGKKLHKVYFIPTLITGDNLGINSILGYTSSFSKSNFCRVCYGGPELKTSSKESVFTLRTVKKYENDIQDPESHKKYGLKERCIFNDLKNFHVIENVCFDVMHDLLEGVCSYVLSQIIIQFVEVDKYFTLDYLNYRLHSTDFSSESGDVPAQISMEYLKKNLKLKMSAAETLFFCRYFSVIVGDLVPHNNQYWELYINLRKIIHIITAPMLTKSDVTNQL